jgi:hypothetical protein
MTGKMKYKLTRLLWTVILSSVLAIVFFFFCLEKQDLGIVCIVREDTQVFRHHERDKREAIATLSAGETVSIIDEIGAKGYGAFLINLRDSHVVNAADRDEKGSTPFVST